MIRKMIVLATLALGMAASAGADIWFPRCLPCPASRPNR